MFYLRCYFLNYTAACIMHEDNYKYICRTSDNRCGGEIINDVPGIHHRGGHKRLRGLLHYITTQHNFSQNRDYASALPFDETNVCLLQMTL